MLYTLTLVAVLLVVMAVARRERAMRRARSVTTSLVIDAEGVRRTLADGRAESARWAAASRIEVVCTPVRTSDGARAFVLVAESDEVGCLVPLGVGYDEQLLARLAGLPGFRLERFEEMRGRRAPSREVVWARR